MDVGVVFDMDGVIMDNSIYHEHAWRSFCQSHGIDLSDEEFNKYIFGRIAKETLDYLFKKDHTNEEVDLLIDEKERIYRKLYSKKIKLVEGLYSFLQELKKFNVPVALATSAPPGNVEFTFDLLPVRNFFDHILDATHVVKGKPDPEMYTKAIGLLGVQPQKCIVFEDSFSGVRSALAAGAKVIGVATTHSPEEFEGVTMVIENFKHINFGTLLSILDKY